ncbi:hypothetical protein Fcan01_20093 [Folsomia candida]|uniref:Uncharacterized protein n=1 Tax=Folsomia candida TaxID=158441 RepID=A0A226DH60_FOLCA|nr:hypothetical protein Fcan01_20093 [Folsomia candida]
MNADINLIVIFVLMGGYISESECKFGHPGTPASATILLNGPYTLEYFQDIDNSARDHPISINTSLIGSYSSLVMLSENQRTVQVLLQISTFPENLGLTKSK